MSNRLGRIPICRIAKRCSLAAVTLCLTLARAQTVPSLINYQGKLTNASNNPLPNGTYGVAVRLWSKKDNSQPGNTLVWGQEYNVAMMGGVFNLILGAPGGTPVANAAVNDLTFAFSDAERYFGITVTKGTNGVAIPGAVEIVPRQQILTTPYAVTASFASTAENVVNGTPPGSIMPFAGSVAPAGWFPCNGAEVSRTIYTNLFAVIGTTYGNGDGATTFNLPDYRGRTLVGIDGGQVEFDSLGKAGGEKTHTLTISEMPPHHHSWSANKSNDQGAYPANSKDTGFTRSFDTTDTGGGLPHNNLQPYTTVNYVIKN